MTPNGQRLHNERVFRVAADRWLEPEDVLPECECERLDCEYCREIVGQRCYGCDKWVERGTLRQSPDPDVSGPWLECERCFAYTTRLMEIEHGCSLPDPASPGTSPAANVLAVPPRNDDAARVCMV